MRSTTRRKLLLLLLLFLFAFAVRAVFPDTSYFFWDETVYLMHGKLLAGHLAGYSEISMRPPALPLLISPFSGLPSYELASRLLVAFLNSFVVFPVYYLAKFVFNKKTAVLAAVIIALLPVHILNSRWVMTDAPGAMLAFSSVAAYLMGLGEGRGGRRFLVYAGGVFAALAVMMKFTNLLLFVLLLPLLLFYIKKRFKDIIISLASGALTLLPYMVFSALRFGGPLSAFSSAFFVVGQHDPVSFGFFLFTLRDSFGLLALFLTLGILLCILISLARFFTPFPAFANLRKSLAFPRLLPYLLFCWLVALAYYFLIMSRGVVKPPGIEWEVERFLLLFALFSVPFISCGIVWSAAFASSLFCRYGSAGRIAAALIVISLTLAAIADHSLLLYPQLKRAYAPAIIYEDGLREATKEAGLFLRNSSFSEFGCIGNCPPISYYSGKMMSAYFTVAALEEANQSAVLVSDDHLGSVSGRYSISGQFCSRRRCLYLVVRR